MTSGCLAEKTHNLLDTVALLVAAYVRNCRTKDLSTVALESDSQRVQIYSQAKDGYRCSRIASKSNRHFQVAAAPEAGTICFPPTAPGMPPYHWARH
jgi:hypothetical protein